MSRSVWTVKLCKFLMLICVTAVVCFAGCGQDSIDGRRIKDLDFTVVPEDKVEAPMQEMIDGQKERAFKLTYSDGPYMYIGIGYGKKDTGGYSIAADAVYLTEDGVRVETSITGPKKSEHVSDTETFPYIVIKIENIDAPVVFD